MARNRARRLPGTLIGRQKQKLRQQRKDKNIATYEREKEERQKRGATGTSYSSHLMGGSSSSSSYNPYSRLKTEEFEVVDEAHWNPVTKKIEHNRPSKDEIESLAAKARTKKKQRKPLGSIRKNSSTFKPSSPEEAKANIKAWDDYWGHRNEEFDAIVEYLYVEGYADTIESAEVMAECISEGWVETIIERKYGADEKLPSGKTPNEKMERAQQRHGANYMLSGGGRHNPARDSHFSRGRKNKKIQDIIKSGEDPRSSSQAGVGWGNDARKIGRPGSTTAERTSRTPKTDNERTSYTQGGLRAHQTRAGGYRKVTRNG